MKKQEFKKGDKVWCMSKFNVPTKGILKQIGYPKPDMFEVSIYGNTTNICTYCVGKTENELCKNVFGEDYGNLKELAKTDYEFIKEIIKSLEDARIMDKHIMGCKMLRDWEADLKNQIDSINN